MGYQMVMVMLFHPGSRDKRSTVLDGRRPLEQANQLEL